jgi:PDZ domain-containing protein
MKRAFRVGALVLLFAATFVAVLVRLPYYAIQPGPAREVEPLISVQGHERFPSSGKLILTTVSWYQVTALQALIAWADPAQSVVPDEDIYPPGETKNTEHQRAISQMDTSKILATSVVLEQLADDPREHGVGALIEATTEGCPAYQQLFAGDLVREIDGSRIRSSVQANRVIDRVPVGEPVSFTVQAAGETHEIRLTREHCAEDVKRPLIGISLVEPFPFQVEIASGDIGGPSAGLMFALGLYDTLTRGDLTAGRTIAGTGEIFPDGTVGPIGGIRDKVVAAQRVGASVFLVPADNMNELDGVDTGDMRLISVRSFDQALRELEDLGGTLDATPGAPTPAASPSAASPS